MHFSLRAQFETEQAPEIPCRLYQIRQKNKIILLTKQKTVSLTIHTKTVSIKILDLYYFPKEFFFTSPLLYILHNLRIAVLKNIMCIIFVPIQLFMPSKFQDIHSHIEYICS